jgi:hypothetical protein
MSAARRQELDMPRSTAAALGTSAVEAASVGYYVNRTGEKVDWSSEVSVHFENWFIRLKRMVSLGHVGRRRRVG